MNTQNKNNNSGPPEDPGVWQKIVGAITRALKSIKDFFVHMFRRLGGDTTISMEKVIQQIATSKRERIREIIQYNLKDLDKLIDKTNETPIEVKQKDEFSPQIEVAITKAAMGLAINKADLPKQIEAEAEEIAKNIVAA